MNGNGGVLTAEVLKRHGVDTIYTLSGGHIFPFYDGARATGIRMVDVRHEQSATWAAEGHAKLTRGIGVSVVTAGPGVTNSISAITSSHFNGSPVLVLGGRAPQNRWGAGSLQEMDHVPVVASITKRARTVFDPGTTPQEVDDAIRDALTPHRGPVFLDFPMDTIFRPVDAEIPAEAPAPRGADPDPDAVKAAANLLGNAEQPVVIAGSDIWWDGAWDALRNLIEALRVPVIVNGMGRGCIPADHELSFSRARSIALKEADVVMVVGTPLDFRLGFGSFGAAKVIHVQDSAGGIGSHASPAAAISGDLTKALDGIVQSVATKADREAWIGRLRTEEVARREKERDHLESDAFPIHPARIYGVLKEKLDRDAIVIGDGGDFVSYAGRFVDSYVPGAWMDPGPYGCLGSGVGYAIAARVVHPDRQIVLMMGDGALGFNAMDFDTMVRHNLPVVAIVGNNGIWGLEKHPMKAIYGWDAAADLNQDTRYDDVVKALGGAGETIEKSAELGAAIDRGFAAGVPYLINVLTDPANAYPRSSTLG